jgi:hypothetical protein
MEGANVSRNIRIDILLDVVDNQLIEISQQNPFRDKGVQFPSRIYVEQVGFETELLVFPIN